MIFLLTTSARFPAPEFEGYKLPAMNLEPYVADSTFWRVGVMVLFLVLSGLGFYRFRSRKVMISLSLAGLVVFGYVFHACPCPVGLFQNIADSAVNGRSISPAYLLLFALPLACALIWGRLFCSGACPLGAVQELMHWQSRTVPPALDRVLRMFPVLILVVFTVAAASNALYPLCYADPYLPLFLMSFPLPFALVTLAFLLLGLFISRPFCRYCCPYGILLRFFAIFAARQPRITVATCINCKLCEQGCPNGAILAPEEKDSIESHSRGTRRLSLLIAGLPLALFAGGIVGYGSAPIMAGLHPEIRLLHDMKEHRKTPSTEAFETSGSSLARLETKARRDRNIIDVGLTLGGIIFAAGLMAELIASARRRKSEIAYEIDSGLCFCCGRCYQTCPLEKRPPAKGGGT